MLMDKMWRVFESTGNIYAYLYYIESAKMLKNKNTKVLDSMAKEEKKAQ